MNFKNAELFWDFANRTIPYNHTDGYGYTETNGHTDTHLRVRTQHTHVILSLKLTF